VGEKVIGIQIGMKSHTYLSEVLKVSKEIGETRPDVVVTLGAGSLTDGAKIAVLVSPSLSSECTFSRRTVHSLIR
jgi:alcohol dehydrogenase class IV